MNVLFISSFAPIVTDKDAAKRLYVEALGLDLDDDGTGYLHSDKVEGSRHFGLWPLEQAAKACFGTDEWPADVPRPQASVEFEVEAEGVHVELLGGRPVGDDGGEAGDEENVHASDGTDFVSSGLERFGL